MPSSDTAAPESGATRADPSLPSICRLSKRQTGAPVGVRYTRRPPLGSGQVVRQLILDQPIRGSNPLSPANLTIGRGPLCLDREKADPSPSMAGGAGRLHPHLRRAGERAVHVVVGPCCAFGRRLPLSEFRLQVSDQG